MPPFYYADLAACPVRGIFGCGFQYFTFFVAEALRTAAHNFTKDSIESGMRVETYIQSNGQDAVLRADEGKTGFPNPGAPQVLQWCLVKAFAEIRKILFLGKSAQLRQKGRIRIVGEFSVHVRNGGKQSGAEIFRMGIHRASGRRTGGTFLIPAVKLYQQRFQKPRDCLGAIFFLSGYGFYDQSDQSRFVTERFFSENLGKIRISIPKHFFRQPFRVKGGQNLLRIEKKIMTAYMGWDLGREKAGMSVKRGQK